MNRLSYSSVIAFLLLASAASLACTAVAQKNDDADGADEQAVARIAYFSGSVSYSRGDDPDDWQQAGLNFPMTLGDRVYTGRDSRLELQMTGANVYLAPSTDLAALNLTGSVRQVSIGEGLASFRIRELRSEDSFEIDTPNASVTVDRPGEYRIEVTLNGRTRVSTGNGSATVAAGGGSLPLRSGQLIEIEGLDQPTYDVLSAPRRDSWDSWVESRARRLVASETTRYVHRDVLGAEDLDDYGRWENVPGYGRCWSPRSVTADWAPYRAGRWAWQDPWGWSWVSTEPWGFAPYHWGRWINASSRWFWVPVGRSERAVSYSPALVAFVGVGAGFSTSVSTGGDGQIGWFPLGPGDRFVRWWGANRRDVAANVTKMTYANRTYMTVVDRSTFVSGDVVTTSTIRDAAILRRMTAAPVSRGAIPYMPVASSLRVSSAAAVPAGIARPSAAVLHQTVVTRLAPPPGKENGQ